MDYLDGLGKPMRMVKHRVLPEQEVGAICTPGLEESQEELEERTHPWSWYLGWRMRPWNFDPLSPPTSILC